MKYFIVTAFFVFIISGCIPAQHIPEKCRNKISASLQQRLTDSEWNDSLDIIISITDTTGIKSAFPKLRFANSKIALGHVTKEEIFSLCRYTGVAYIELPKTLYPKK